MHTARVLPLSRPRTPRVLMVFDDATMIARYDRSLRGAGFDVTVDCDFERAIIRVAVELPDVVVIDVPSRRKECMRFLQRAFNDARTHSIPVVLISDQKGAAPRVQSRMLSHYPRWDAPNCLGSHLLRWFGPRHDLPPARS